MECRELVSVAELTSSERAAFVGALLALKASPSMISAAAAAVTAGGGTPNRYDDYVWMHSTVSGGAHFGPAFGPWHREFLRQLEFDLRDVSGNPSIVIPYWDWTTGASSASANWPFTDDLVGPLGNAAGEVTSGPFSDPTTWRMNIRRMVIRDNGTAQVPDTNLRLRRRPATVTAPFALPSAATARLGMAQTTPYDAAPFNEMDDLDALVAGGATDTQINNQILAWINGSFRKFLEWRLHNGPHVWVGGEDDWPSGTTPTFIAGPMSIPAVSPNDPIFWLHHCNVDRLWSVWQQRHPPMPGGVAVFVPSSGADPGHNLMDEMVHFESAAAGNFNTPPLGHPADVVDSRGVLDVWYTSDLPIITLVTPSVDFGDVPAQLTTDWPVKFDVRTCRPVVFRITAVGGTNFSEPPGQGDVSVDHSDTIDPQRVNVFVEFEALGTAGVTQPGTVTIAAFIDDDEGYYGGTVGAEYQVGTWSITLSARPVATPQAAVVLVLDRSGSMGGSAGAAGTKYDLLQSSLRTVASIMRDDDAVGLVSYDELIDTITPAMLPMGAASPPGPGRAAIENAIVAGDLTPRGDTAIGQGMIAGASLLGTVQADTNYPIKAMVVLTDGNENVHPYVTESAVTTAISWFSDAVYAIGLGSATNVSTTTLGAIANYQLITGSVTDNERRFLLTKYFLQILADITDSAVIVDPQGELRKGEVHEIPFEVADSDVSIDVIAMCPVAPLLDLTLRAPDGTMIHAGSGPNVALQIDSGDEFYRIRLPAIPGNDGSHAGRWTAVLRVRELDGKALPHKLTQALMQRDSLNKVDRSGLAEVMRRGALPYSLFVQSYSNLDMKVDVVQDGFAPGSTLELRARLQEYRRPLAGSARVIVEITQPDGSEVRVALAQQGPGNFRGEYVAHTKGVYLCRFRASGSTRGGRRFQREETRSAAIDRRLAPGGDLATPTTPSGGGDQHRDPCTLLACLLREPSIIRWLEKQAVDPKEIAACLKRYCVKMPHATKPAEHALEHADANELLRRELATLREQLQVRQGQSALPASDRWSALMAPSPVAKPVARKRTLDAPGARAVAKLHEHHHMMALPVVHVTEDGSLAVRRPKAALAMVKHDHDAVTPAGGQGTEPGKAGPPKKPPHDHGGG